MYILLECVSTQRTVTSKGYRLTISDVSWIPVQQELWPLNTVDSSTYNRSTSNGTQHVNTLPETNNSHLKMKVGRLVFPLGWPIFQGYVSFRESSRKRNHALAGCDNSRQTIVDRRSLAAVNFLENLPFLWKEFICCKQIKYTWNLNDLYFWRSTPQNKAFSNKNKGHLSSRYIYIYLIYLNMYINMYIIEQHLRSFIPNMLLKTRSLQKNNHSNFAKGRVPQGRPLPTIQTEELWAPGAEWPIINGR